MVINMSMSPQIINLEEREELLNIREIWLSPEVPALWITNDGQKIQSYCVACTSRPCMQYTSEEIQESEILSNDFEFRANSAYKTCVVNAIKFNEESNTPIIDENSCFGCGICMERCPTKAIYLTNTSAKVNINKIINEDKLASISFYNNFFTNIKKAKTIGIYRLPNERNLKILMSNLKNLIENKNSKLDINLLSRNLMRSQGYLAISYSQGVQYSTIDLIAINKYNNETVIIEVEPTNAIETPRILLVALAIMVERHKLDDNNTRLLSIGLIFPNNREEFWNVVDDIKEVLDLDIRFITIPSIITMLWLAKNQKLTKFLNQTSSQNKKNMREILGIEEELINLPIGFERIFESSK